MGFVVIRHSLSNQEKRSKKQFCFQFNKYESNFTLWTNITSLLVVPKWIFSRSFFQNLFSRVFFPQSFFFLTAFFYPLFGLKKRAKTLRSNGREFDWRAVANDLFPVSSRRNGEKKKKIKNRKKQKKGIGSKPFYLENAFATLFSPPGASIAKKDMLSDGIAGYLIGEPSRMTFPPFRLDQTGDRRALFYPFFLRLCPSKKLLRNPPWRANKIGPSGQPKFRRPGPILVIRDGSSIK